MNETRLVRVFLFLFGLILVAVSADVVSDVAEGASLSHVVAEGIVAFAAAAGLALLVRRLVVQSRTSRAALREELEASRQEALRWRDEAHEALEGLGVAIDRQFARWELTPAEKEVALLMLKGLSHREIAEVRDVTERTVRQQAHAVYGKAGLAGRADLAAFFLEDLLLPRGDRA